MFFPTTERAFTLLDFMLTGRASHEPLFVYSCFHTLYTAGCVPTSMRKKNLTLGTAAAAAPAHIVKRNRRTSEKQKN